MAFVAPKESYSGKVFEITIGRDKTISLVVRMSFPFIPLREQSSIDLSLPVKSRMCHQRTGQKM